MYPFIRMIKELIVTRKAPALPLLGEHVSHHICWPWDLDIWMELNNGRTLTLYDLGRIPLARRTGLIGALRDNRWGLTMAGATVRYRRRVRMFDRVSIRSRAVYWDDRFIYLEQSMWRRDGECANHIIYRSAVTSRDGIVSPERVMQALGQSISRPPASPFLAAWIASEDLRPWPPMSSETAAD